MLSSIHPLGEQGRGNKFWVTATAFVVGATFGGAVVGLLGGAIGLALTALGRLLNSFGPDMLVRLDGRAATLAVVGVVAFGFEALGRQLPSLRRQVDENWLGQFRGWVYGVGFGSQLGFGVATYITAAEVWIWLGATILVDSLAASLLIGLTFGAIRGLSIFGTKSVRSSQQLVSFHHNLHRYSPLVRPAGVATTATLTALAVGVAARTAIA